MFDEESRAVEPNLAIALQQVQVRPESPEAFNNYGIALAQNGCLEEAHRAFAQAVRLRPSYSNALHNLSNVLRLLQRLPEAELALLRAIAFHPTDVDLYLQLGQIYRLQGRSVEALAAYTSGLHFAPDNIDLLGWQGTLLTELGRPNEAIVVLQRAIELQPKNAKLHAMLGYAHRQGNNADAEAPLRETCRLAPDDHEAAANLASLLVELGAPDEAATWAERACTLKPSPAYRVLAASILPAICDSNEHLDHWRGRFHQRMGEAIESGVRIDPSTDTIQHFFYLSYHGRNSRDLMALLSRLGEGPRAWTAPPVRRTPRDRIRVGFVSRHLKEHTIGLLNQGLIRRLDRQRFEVIVMQIGGPQDGRAQAIAACADRVVPLHLPMSRILPAIAAEQLDVLYFTDIGMDPINYTIAFNRLAPVQCSTWGHPETSGLPTVDYFLSSVDLETENGQDHYTEELVRLPRLGVWYERPALTGPPNRADFGLPSGVTLYGCPQSLFKFHPEFDPILQGILEADPQGVLVVLEGANPQWRNLLVMRWQRTLGKMTERIVWTKRVSRSSFWRLNASFDVLLDPIHFGGGNTTYEALAVGQPIVTWPSEFLRARLTYAMYRQMGLTDLVVSSAEEYIAKAVQLGCDRDYRQHIRQQILDRAGVLFQDDEAVRAVERFLEQAVQRVRGQ